MMATRSVVWPDRGSPHPDITTFNGGLLDVELGVVAGKTRIIRQRSRPPLHALQTSSRTGRCTVGARGWAPRPDEDRQDASGPRLTDGIEQIERPEPAELMLVSTGPGMLQGDRWVVRLAARNRARVCILTQASARIHGAPSGEDAELSLSLHAEGGSCLVYWPEPTILYARAALRQSVALFVGPEATVVFRDILVPGRLARGEAFQFERHVSTVAGYALERRSRSQDPSLVLLPKGTSPTGTSFGRSLRSVAESGREPCPEAPSPYRGGGWDERSAKPRDDLTDARAGLAKESDDAHNLGAHGRAPPQSDIGHHILQESSDFDGELLFCDALRLSGEVLCSSAAIGRFGTHPVVGSMLVLSPGSSVADLADRIAVSIPPPGDVLAGVTVLPNQAGVLCRVLGTTASAVDRALCAARDAVAECPPLCDRRRTQI